MVDPAIEKTILWSRHLERCGCRNQLNLYFFIALPWHPASSSCAPGPSTRSRFALPLMPGNSGRCTIGG